MARLADDIFYLPPILINGIPNPFWSTYQKDIGAFIRKNDLKPVSSVVEKVTVDMRAVIEWIKYLQGRYGGNRGPHFHYKGDVYYLNSEQWRNFSKPIIQEFSNKLAEAATVHFEQFMEITDTMKTMGELYK